MKTTPTRPRGEGLLRKMFAENRKMMRDLNALDIGPGISAGYSRKMRGNPRSGRGRPFPSQVSRIPPKSSRLNDQCFDFDSTEYPETSYFRNQRGRQNARGAGVRRAPYQVSAPNRASKREWAEGSPQLASREWTEEPQSMMISVGKGGSGLGSASRSIWKSDKPSTTSPKVAPFGSSAGIGRVNSSSNSLSSSWFPDGKNRVESSYQNNRQESNSASRYGNSFDSEPFSRRDMNGSKPTNSSQGFEFDRYFDYEDRFNDSFLKKPKTKAWGTPPHRDPGVDTGEFYAKVCDAVFEKVVQQLRSDTCQVNQKPTAESLSSPVYATNISSSYPSFKTGPIRGNPSQRGISQRSGYPDRMEYASKPSFNPSFRGRGAGRVSKRKFSPRSRTSLL